MHYDTAKLQLEAANAATATATTSSSPVPSIADSHLTHHQPQEDLEEWKRKTHKKIESVLQMKLGVTMKKLENRCTALEGENSGLKEANLLLQQRAQQLECEGGKEALEELRAANFELTAERQEWQKVRREAQMTLSFMEQQKQKLEMVGCLTGWA